MNKKTLLCSLLSIFLSICIHAQIKRDTTKYYSFNVNYWFNLHHYLWLESFMQVNEDSTIIDQKLSKSEKVKLDKAISYYSENLIEEDLRTSDYMTAFKFWITNQNKVLNEIPDQFREHMKALQEVSSVYEKVFWPIHEKACKSVLNEYLPLIIETEETFVQDITKLTRQFWQEEKLPVDITYVAKVTKWNLRNRPYTSLFPTYVVMNAIGENDVKGNWLELLYHESAHHLILSSNYFVGGTINDVVETMDIKMPRQLGHSYLFYFTGQLTKQLLEKSGIVYDETYMVRNGLYKRYYPLLDKHLKAYMRRETTLVEATENIIEGLK
ncbi:hypothetical protein [Ekhidna sp.]